MKAILFIALVCSLTLALPYSEEDEANKVLDFLKGFLEGLGEKGNLEELKKCVKGGENIIDKIIEAIKLIKEKKLQSIIKGVKLLVEAVTELLGMLQPCMESFKELKKLVEKLKHLDITKIALKILGHLNELIGYIMNAIDCFQKQQFECAGKNIGQFLRVVFLGDRLTADPIIEFFMGFLEGLNEGKSVEDLMKCLKSVEAIVNEIIEAIKLIKKGDIGSVIEGVTKLLAALTKLMNMIKPCTDGYNQLKKLIEAIAHVDIKKIAMKILFNLNKYINLMKELIEAFMKKEMKTAGLKLGKLLYDLFLTDREEEFN